MSAENTKDLIKVSWHPCENADFEQCRAKFSCYCAYQVPARSIARQNIEADVKSEIIHMIYGDIAREIEAAIHMLHRSASRVNDGVTEAEIAAVVDKLLETLNKTTAV